MAPKDGAQDGDPKKDSSEKKNHTPGDQEKKLLLDYLTLALLAILLKQCMK